MTLSVALDSATTAELVALAQQGGTHASAAFEQLLQSNQSMLSALIRRVGVGFETQAEDLRQIASVAFASAVKAYDGSGTSTFSTFAWMMVGHRLQNEIRSQRRDHIVAASPQVPERSDPAWPGVFDDRLTAMVVRSELARMSAADRELVSRLLERGGSQTLVARDLGISQPAVAKRKRRIVGRIKYALNA